MGIRDHKAKRRSQTLDELEGVVSRAPVTDDTSLITKYLGLRKVPIGQFTVEDLRFMIGQRDGLMFLVPPALEHLASDPLAEGNYFPGDLLCMVLGAGTGFWQRHSQMRAEVERVVAKLSEVPAEVSRALAEFRA